MSNQQLVQKLWNLCNVLRDDGITYHQYVTELTYILFLKMLNETGNEQEIFESVQFRYDELTSKSNRNNLEETELGELKIIKDYTWKNLTKIDGLELKNYYNKLLRILGTHGKGNIQSIYHDARSNINEPRNILRIIKEMDKLDWFSVERDEFGDLYEGLLEKNANEKKSGAGQYFTPRPLIDVMTDIIKPQLGEKCNDPACGTFGFMIAAASYVKEHNREALFNESTYKNFRNECFTGCELVADTYRLALMNAMIHGLHSKIINNDTLSSIGKDMSGYDVVMANPPFGTKKGGENITRDDFPVKTKNKQLNFLQHIYRSLKVGGRAGVVLPDNVLFADNDGQRIRENLMRECNLHTILRLPTGIFYAQGVKTNVLFFEKGTTTTEVSIFDMRSNMPSFGVTTPLTRGHFDDFVETFTTHEHERWSVYTMEEIKNKNYSLDLGLMIDDSLTKFDDLPDPITSGEEIIADLEQVIDLMQSVVKQLKNLDKTNDR